MKSKPPNKKARVDTTSSSNDSSSPAKNQVNSPAASTSKASVATTASEILAAAKLAAAATAAEKTAGANSLKASRNLPTYPTIYMPDILNSKDYTRMAQIVTATNNATGTGTTLGRPPESLTMEDMDILQSELESLWSNISVRIRNLRREQTALQNSPNVVTNVAAVLGEHFDPHHQEKINAVATLMDAGHGTRTSVSAAAKLVMGAQIPISIGSSTVTALLPIAPATPGSSRKSTSTISTPSSTASSKEKQKQPKKKLKGEIESKSKKSNDKPARAGQNRSHSMSSDDSTLFHQKAPNQFWDFADSYVREITPEHLDALDRTIAEHSKSLPDSIFNIPPVGKHYLRGVGAEDSAGLGGPTSDRGAFVTGARRFADPSKSGDICGPLTQRLVSALVEDRISGYNYATQNNNNNSSTTNNHSNSASPNPSNTTAGNPNRDEANQGFFINRPGLVRALGLDGGLTGGQPLDARIRQVLLEQGVLLADDAEDASLIHPNDEILADIKNTQATLKKLHLQNADKLREMRELAKREIERAAMKKDLEKADKEVLEAYRLISSCRMKKKSLTKKERDVATKALEGRTAALLRLQDQPQMESTVTTSQSHTLSQPSVPL